MNSLATIAEFHHVVVNTGMTQDTAFVEPRARVNGLTQAGKASLHHGNRRPLTEKGPKRTNFRITFGASTLNHFYLLLQ
jgi:hypothetical protein